MPELDIPQMFCFIKFHHFTAMTEFIEKHKSKFEIHEAHEILEWFINKEETLKNPDLTGPF